jgi:NADPH-dependent glutamate synthase beta subunit-like oxidoreductase
MTARQSDFTPVIDMLRQRSTGPARAQRPVYVDLLPPCNNACPAGENVQAWLDLAQAGKYREAWEAILRDNPFPAVHGRVCYHPCETHCNRGQLDSAVSIHAVERFLGDLAAEQAWAPPVSAAPSGRRILVVGGGPSGLSAAYHLACRGHSVEVRDAGPLPGGMLHFGIPAYRLPRADLMNEVHRIEAMGVRLTLNHKVEDVLLEQAEGHFDAVFIAIGAQIGRRVDIPARDAGRVIDAITLLHDVETGDPPCLGRRVIIYGGGNTAIDAARTARRLGAEEALIVYRRDRSHMPAQEFEADEALSEGIKIKWLSTIKDVGEGELTVEVMRLDEKGLPHPTGQLETLSADSVVLALGQQTDSGFLRGVPDIVIKSDGTVIVDAGMMTGHAGIFAGGDMVPSERTVTAAVGHGKKAARHIDAWLRSEPSQVIAKHPVVTFDQLKLPIYTDAPRSLQSELTGEERLGGGFVETTSGLSEAEAHYEARRCLSCGNCFECDNCYAACPETAIVKLGPSHGFRVNTELCTGCAVCVEQCPCHAMEMVPEDAPDPANAREASR